jgi:hypothetical protein
MRTFFCCCVLLAVAVGCSPSFRADLQEIEITQRCVQVPGVPVAAQVGTMSTTHSFALSSGRMGWAKKINSDVQIHQVKIAAIGLADMSFLELARVTASAPPAPDVVEIVSYVRDPLAPASPIIDVSAPAPVDITSLWQAEHTVIELQIAGTLPTQDWALDLTLTLSGRIAYAM